MTSQTPVSLLGRKIKTFKTCSFLLLWQKVKQAECDYEQHSYLHIQRFPPFLPFPFGLVLRLPLRRPGEVLQGHLPQGPLVLPTAARALQLKVEATLRDGDRGGDEGITERVDKVHVCHRPG